MHSRAREQHSPLPPMVLVAAPSRVKAATDVAMAVSPRDGPVADGPLGPTESMRMMMLKSVLQGKLGELVMMTKIGEEITMTTAENAIDELCRMQPEEDLFMLLRYCDQPVAHEDVLAETTDSLIVKVIDCLDWGALKDALGLSGGKGGKKGRRASIFDDFVTRQDDDESKRPQSPLPVKKIQAVGAQYLQQCLAQGVATVARVAAKHAQAGRPPVNVRPRVPKPRGSVLGARTGKRGRAAFRKKRRAGNEKIKGVYDSAVEAELSATSDFSLGRGFSAQPPPGSRGSTGSRGSRSSRGSGGRFLKRGNSVDCDSPPTENTGERLKFERMLRDHKKAAAAALLPMEESSSDDDSEEDDFDETDQMREDRERVEGEEAEAAERARAAAGRGRGKGRGGRGRGRGRGRARAQLAEPEPEPEPESIAAEASQTSMASGLSTGSLAGVLRRHDPEQTE
eukprot:COSAG06_NODE_11531_length_1496_cov_2.665712_1_plen_453_part_01